MKQIKTPDELYPLGKWHNTSHDSVNSTSFKRQIKIKKIGTEPNGDKKKTNYSKSRNL